MFFFSCFAFALVGCHCSRSSGLFRNDQELLNGRVIARDLVGVEVSQETIHILHALVLDISQGLDLACDSLQIIVRKSQAQLLSSVLDGVPSSKAMTDRDISRHTEHLGLENLICGRVVEDGLGVDTGLVCEGTIASDAVVERNLDLHGIGNQVLEVTELVKLVLGGNIVGIDSEHTSNQVSNGSDSVALANAENRGVDVSGAGLEGSVGVGGGTSSI